MSILQYASPQARYYKSDRDIMADYDNRINIYNAALEKYKGEAGVYQGKVDAFNKTIEDYNKELEDWRRKAQAYNTAIEAWNQTDRTTPYTEWSGYAASPGDWFKTAPVFEGGTAPVAPEDPGFSGKDVDAFVESAQARAIRRGNTAATAQQVLSSPGQYYVAGRENFGSQPEVSLAGMSGFGSSAMGFENGGNPAVESGIPVSEMTQDELLSSGTLEPYDVLMNYAVNPDVYYADARKQWDRGNYGSAVSDYIMGLTGELPGSSTLAAALAGAMERADRDRGDKTTAQVMLDTLKNLMVNDEGVPHLFAEPAVRNYQEGGVAGLFQQYAQGGAVSAITEEALTAMRNKVINDYGFDPVDIALEEGVDPDLYLRVMYAENRGRQGPVSSAGAIGLMQLMPATARELGVDPNNPLENARGGARYLLQQLNEFQSVPLALAAYNAGPSRVRRYGGVPPIEETRNYVAQIYGVDTGEILPSMDNFYTRVPGEDPSPRPQPRPAGLGTPGYIPELPAPSEYLMEGIGQVFMDATRTPEARPVFIPNIMQNQPEPVEEARGIDFYRQYAALPMPEDVQQSQSLTSSLRT